MSWMKAYERISFLTGVKLKDASSGSYVLITNPDNKYYARVGVFVDKKSLQDRIYVKFNGKRKLEEFDTSKEGNEVIWSRNVPELLKNLDDLYKLFSD